MKALEAPAANGEQPTSALPGPVAPSDKSLDDSEVARLASRAAIDGVAYGACVAVPWGQRVMGGELVNLPDAMKELRKSGNAINAGDLRQVEGMLLAQASALNGIFSALARRAACALDQDFSAPAVEFNLRLALKAQAQSRATLETLANVKNPKAVAFVRQANIANGPQQVNNGGGGAPGGASPAGESHLRPNELLENEHGERLEFGAQGAAGGADPHLETVGTVDRPH